MKESRQHVLQPENSQHAVQLFLPISIMGIEDTDIKDNGNAGCSSMLYSKTHKFADGTPKYSVAWISFIVIFTQIINVWLRYLMFFIYAC